MKTKDKIIKFMWGKQKQLDKYKIYQSYMNKEVEEEINKISEAEWHEVWKKIKISIIVHNISGLSVYVCPFCVLLNNSFNCQSCGYGLINGICLFNEGVYNHIVYNRNYSGKGDLIFSNDFYRELINSIERGEQNDT